MNKEGSVNNALHLHNSNNYLHTSMSDSGNGY